MSKKVADILTGLRRDVAANKKKSALLAGLFVLLFAIAGRALFGGKDPAEANAQSPVPPKGAPPVPVPVDSATASAGSGTRRARRAGDNGAWPVIRVETPPDPLQSRLPVPVDQFPRSISRDPFRSPTWLSHLAANDDQAGAGPGPGLLERLIREWSDMQVKQHIIEAEIDKRLSDLKLQSTLIGPVNSAYISGRLVHPGDQVNGFSVVRIEPKRVTLRDSGIERVLTVP